MILDTFGLNRKFFIKLICSILIDFQLFFIKLWMTQIDGLDLYFVCESFVVLPASTEKQPLLLLSFFILMGE